MSGKPIHNLWTRRSTIALRIAIGSAVLAWALALSIVSRSQSGPGWEVPSDVIVSLDIGPRFTIALIIVATAALIQAVSLGNIPRAALIGTVTVLVTSVLVTAVIIQLEPAQWPVRHPKVSAVARLITWPTIIVSGTVFWLFGFYFGAPSSMRRPLQLFVGIMTSIIGVLLCLAGLYALMFMM
ncbi:MAG TPA: hypothetical protein VJM50_04210 [Pyrinomonadaceae bacterium]|nr:hypothetical protein [Pyrinomonadaceae bacterium]